MCVLTTPNIHEAINTAKWHDNQPLATYLTSTIFYPFGPDVPFHSSHHLLISLTNIDCIHKQAKDHPEWATTVDIDTYQLVSITFHLSQIFHVFGMFSNAIILDAWQD